MALFRCGTSGGGGSGIDIDVSSPDVHEAFSLSANGSKTIAVTQKPKFIIAYGTASSANRAACVMYDVEADKTLDGSPYGGVANNGFVYGVLHVNSVSSNSVVIKSDSTGYSFYVGALIYY